MIPLVEDYLSELVQGKLDYLKANPEHVGKVLGIGGDKLRRLVEYVKSTPVRITKGYPRTAAELPSICILLSGEQESQITLGDYIDDTQEFEVSVHTEDLEVINTEGAREPYGYVEVSNKPLTEVARVYSEHYGTLTEDQYWISNEDLGLIAIPSLDHGDRVSVSYTYKSSTSVSSEFLYECNYRLEVWTNNGDLTVSLYHLLKWALLSGRDSLVEKGLFRQKLSGADFEPAPSYIPEFVYRRAISFWCQLDASIPTEEVPYISNLYVDESVTFDTGGKDNGRS